MLPEFKMVWEDKYDPTDITFPAEWTERPGLWPQGSNSINHNLNVNILPWLGKKVCSFRTA